MHVEHFWYKNASQTISASWHYTIGFISIVSMVAGAVFNGLVIFAFFRNDALRRPRNYFLINLAITDLGLLLTNNTMHIISSFRREWIFGQRGCNFYSVCGGIFGLTSVATMAAISMTRLAAVNDPFSSLKLTGRFTLVCLIFSWIYGTIWIIPPLFGWSRFILEGFGTSCTFDYISKDRLDKSFMLVLMIGGFFIPLTVILLSYTTILVKLSRRARRLKYETRESRLTTKNILLNEILNSTSTLEISEDRRITENFRRTELRATRTALLILLLFCSAWGPYTSMALLSSFGFDRWINPYTTSILGTFTKLSACINPLVYALSLRSFRQEICGYVKCLYKCQSKHAELHRVQIKNLSENQSRHRTRWNSMNRLNV